MILVRATMPWRRRRMVVRKVSVVVVEIVQLHFKRFVVIDLFVRHIFVGVHIVVCLVLAVRRLLSAGRRLLALECTRHNI